MTDVTRNVHELEVSPIANLIGAVSPPDDFYNLCQARLHCDEYGNECALELSCCLGDMCWSRTVDLSPIVEAVKHGLATYHSKLHHDNVSGWNPTKILSKAKRIATSVAKSKAAKSLWKEVSPYLKDELKNLPGGAAAYKAALKASRALEEARDGNPRAVAAIKKLVAKAQTDPQAAKLLKTTRAMHWLMDAKAAKGGVAQAKTGVWYSLDDDTITDDDLEGVSYEIGKRGKLARKMKLRVVKAQAKRNRQAATRSRLPAGQRPPRVRAEPMPEPESDDEESDDYTDEELDSQDDYYDETGDTSVEGWREWLYHKPYRSPLQSIVDISPGIGMAMRAMYFDGLQTILAKR